MLPDQHVRLVVTPAWATRLNAGSIAVTIDTVMTECGSMKTRWAFWYVVRPAATESALQQLLEDADHDGFRVHVMFVDLDGFKAVNDRHGHAAGDRVLQESANRLRAVLRDEDVLGRFGGDEFVVVLSEQHSPGGDLAARVCSRLRDAMVPPIVVDGHACQLGASIGTAAFPDDARELHALLQCADAAMYEAKRARRATPPR